MSATEIWITGIGILSPLGVGKEAVLASLKEGKSGVGRVTLFDIGDFPVQLGAEVKDFNPRSYVKNRKALKISRRNSHLALAAGKLAWIDAGFDEDRPDPDRTGIIMSAGRITGDMEEICPLTRRSRDSEGNLDLSAYIRNAPDYLPPYWFLRHIPNMVPGHLSIELKLKGPCNTNCMTVVGGLLALDEAAAVIRRGQADAMLAGGADTFLEPYHYITHYQLNRLDPRPENVPRPFHEDSMGTVLGESSTILVLENRTHAEKRGRMPYAVWEDFESGKFVVVPEDSEPVIRRKPSGPEIPPRVTALGGTGLPVLDRTEAGFASGVKWTCYRSGSGWLGGTIGPHDLACLLLEAQTGIVGDSFPVEAPLAGTEDRWTGCQVRSGDRLSVQALSWNGQFARLTVRMP